MIAMTYHVHYPEVGFTDEEVINPFQTGPSKKSDELNVVALAEQYPDAIYYEVLPEAKAVPVAVTVCSACGSAEGHHVEYVIEHGVCVV